MKKLNLIALLLFLALFQTAPAQDKELLADKPGTYKIIRNPLNKQGPDLYGKSCNISDIESEESLQSLEKLVRIFMALPVLKENKGFDGVFDLGGGSCNSRYGYGVTSTVCLYFRTWSMRNGKETQWTVEPPQWRFSVNMTDKFCSNGFNVSDYSNAYNPTNPAFNENSMHKATVALKELFFQPGIREHISPGIDRYGDNVVIFNPDRPGYWEQVTIREVFRLMIGYWKLMPDKAQSDVMVPVLTGELNRFSEAEKDSYAYLGNPESISRIGSVRNDTPVMRPDPDYWNRNLPRSAIQIIIMEVPSMQVVKSKMNDCLRRGDGYYYVYRLLSELDLSSFILPLE
jgi:hypothetical protein